MSQWTFRLFVLGALVLGCAEADAEPPGVSTANRIVLQGGLVVGLGAADVALEGGQISAVGTVATNKDDQLIDASGRWLVPAFIDSHVHLAYLPAQDEMARGGVAAAVDHAAPLSFFEQKEGPLALKLSGPMVTAELGYPTQSWGANGYGLQCADAEAAQAAVQQLAKRGAGLIKIPLTSGPSLSSEAFQAAANEAHAHGLKVSSHALAAEFASQAAQSGADILAHTPTELLDAATIELWSKRAVISTLRAFGGGAAAQTNLAALAEAGATVLYGTDFGNTTDAGIDGQELELMLSAGLSAQQVLDAGTKTPAQFWGFDALGSIEVGKAASLLVLRADPLLEPSTLAQPDMVFIGGQRQ